MEDCECKAKEGKKKVDEIFWDAVERPSGQWQSWNVNSSEWLVSNFVSKFTYNVTITLKLTHQNHTLSAGIISTPRGEN